MTPTATTPYTHSELSEDEFEARFPLIVNHLNPNAGWNFGQDRGCLFETYGEELAFIRQQDHRCVWTLVDDDYGDPVVVSGFHYVNRIGYFVSTVAVPERADFYVPIWQLYDSDDYLE